ncbi:hypothetical protein Tco_0855609 [Tanacetum coccineum]
MVGYRSSEYSQKLTGKAFSQPTSSSPLIIAFNSANKVENGGELGGEDGGDGGETVVSSMVIGGEDGGETVSRHFQNTRSSSPISISIATIIELCRRHLQSSLSLSSPSSPPLHRHHLHHSTTI